MTPLPSHVVIARARQGSRYINDNRDQIRSGAGRCVRSGGELVAAREWRLILAEYGSDAGAAAGTSDTGAVLTTGRSRAPDDPSPWSHTGTEPVIVGASVGSVP